MRRRAVATGAAVIGTAVAGYLLLVRRWQLRWGRPTRNATPLAGDDLIANPDLTATRAITVPALADRVWPWIVQLGQGRGGFYSYDALENLVGCDIHSADRVVPQWQDLKVGDQVKLHPEVGLGVAVVEPGRALVLRGGVPMGAAASYDFTWAFCPAGAAGGDDPAAGPRALRLHPAVGAVAGRAGCGGRLRDDPTDAPRDQGSRRTRRPANGMNWAGEMTMGQFAGRYQRLSVQDAGFLYLEHAGAAPACRHPGRRRGWAAARPRWPPAGGRRPPAVRRPPAAGAPPASAGVVAPGWARAAAVGR